MLNENITGHIDVVRRTEWGETEVARIGLDGPHEYTCTVTSSNMTAAVYALIHVNTDGHRLELGSLAVEAAIPFPHNLTLAAFPNPFNPAVTIRPNLGHRGDVSIRIHDPRGRVVVTLYEGSGMNCPESLIWEGRDASGREAPSGVYLATFKADGKRASRKIVLAR